MSARWTFSVLSTGSTPDRSVTAAAQVVALSAQDLRPRCSCVLGTGRRPLLALMRCPLEAIAAVRAPGPAVATVRHCLRHSSASRVSLGAMNSHLAEQVTLPALGLARGAAFALSSYYRLRTFPDFAAPALSCRDSALVARSYAARSWRSLVTTIASVMVANSSVALFAERPSATSLSRHILKKRFTSAATSGGKSNDPAPSTVQGHIRSSECNVPRNARVQTFTGSESTASS